MAFGGYEPESKHNSVELTVQTIAYQYKISPCDVRKWSMKDIEIQAYFLKEEAEKRKKSNGNVQGRNSNRRKR